MALWLPPVFAAAALVYAMVGFGGGSTYTALLALADTDYRVLPLVALACNILVAAGGLGQFAAAGLVPWQRAAPLLAASIPAAWLGGRLPVPETAFFLGLGAALAIAGFILLTMTGHHTLTRTASRARRSPVVLPLAAVLGFFSGLVGIGGGIFLAPVLYCLGWARPRAIAATAAFFILVNSVAGMAGQLMKDKPASVYQNMLDHWPLLLAVAIGGGLGSRLGTTVLPEKIIRRLTGMVVLLIGLRILWRAGTLLVIDR